MKIAKTELAAKINKLKSVVPKTATSASVGILVKDNCLIASNTEMTVKTKLEGIDNETFIIPAKAFDLISNLPDGTVEIIKNDNTEIVIQAEKISNTYLTVDPETYPTPRTIVEEENEITITADKLLTSIKRIMYAISNIGTNPVMTAMCLKAENGILNYVGSDGHVVAWDKIDFEGDFQLLIPKNAVEKLSQIGLMGNVKIMHNKVSAAFVTDEYEVYTRLIAGNYFKYDSVFKDLELHTVINRADLLNSLIRARMCVKDVSPVVFMFKGSELNVSIKDSITDYNETVFLQEDISSEIDIAFNAQYVIDTLKAFDCDNIGIQLTGPRAPLIIEAEDSDFRAVVLPVIKK